MLRNYTTGAPFYVVASVSLGLAAIVPGWAAPWMAAVGVGMIPIATHLSYRVPAPGLPAWLREDIAAGLVEPARPDFLDRATFWLLMVLGTVGTSGLLIAGFSSLAWPR
jgi:hypothetical protein